MLQFKPAGIKWWNKPLVNFDGKILPAELVVLLTSLLPSESGLWLNSRGLTTGVSDLQMLTSKSGKPEFKTVRTKLPEFVAQAINDLYVVSGLSHGCPDLVLWDTTLRTVRFIEVKCPIWDKPFNEQIEFMKLAKEHGMKAEIVEWVFSENNVSLTG